MDNEIKNWVSRQFVKYNEVISEKYQPIIPGKTLTDNNYSDEDKRKVNSFKEYDDTQIRKEIEKLSDVSELENKIDSKVDKKDGYGLSQNDFTDEIKNMLQNLHNYNDSAIKQNIEVLGFQIDKLKRENEMIKRNQIKSITQDGTKLVFKFNNETQADFDLEPIVRAICGLQKNT